MGRAWTRPKAQPEDVLGFFREKVGPEVDPSKFFGPKVDPRPDHNLFKRPET